MNRKNVVWLIILCLLISSIFLWAEFSSGIATSKDANILKGKWLRPDGGYVIDIRAVDPATGKVEAAYFNPNPIHVAKAQMQQKKGGTALFIELRDQGYPGCTYNLAYDVQQDQLKGVYYQAAIQESYNIFFVRLNEGK